MNAMKPATVTLIALPPLFFALTWLCLILFPDTRAFAVFDILWIAFCLAAVLWSAFAFRKARRLAFICLAAGLLQLAFFLWLRATHPARTSGGETASVTSNFAASGNGAATFLFHAGRQRRAVPEPRRYA